MFNLNEELIVKTDKKLRDAVHDIVTTLEKDEFFDLGTISNILRHQYKIYITPNLLERLLDLWYDDKESIFTKDDTDWLSWDKKEKIIENNLKKKSRKGVLGKSKRKLKKKEEEEVYNSVRGDGWVKIRDGRFVYKGTKTFDVSDNEITKNEFEKETYGVNENPIVPELINKVFIFGPNDMTEPLPNLIYRRIDDMIKEGEIKTKPRFGEMYYYECFRKLLDIGSDFNLERRKGWEEYAPTKMKKMFVRRDKRKKFEEDQNISALKTLITDREDAFNKIEDMVDLDKKYYLIVTKYNTKKQKFMIKSLIYGYFTISDEKYEDGYYKVVMRKEKNGNDIIFFNTLKHFEICLEGGLKEKMIVFNIIEPSNIKKLKIYFNELKRFKGWDEFLDKNHANMIKNDF